MKLDKQRNFYDDKRYFQGKDNPGDFHPDPKAGSSGPSPVQIVFGLIFLGLVGFGLLSAFRTASFTIPVSTTSPAAK